MKQKFQNLGLILNRDAQKILVGGDNNQDPYGDEFACPGSCETDRDCTSVNKGKCTISCDNGKKRCDAW